MFLHPKIASAHFYPPQNRITVTSGMVWWYGTWYGSKISYHTANPYQRLIHLTTKPAKWYVRPAKTQISLGIRPVLSESSLCAQWVAKDPSFLPADSEDSDQTGRMPRLI